MILGFKPQFPEPIKKGIKKHTIREDKHNRWKAGIIIHMATGVRTKLYNCFKKTTCTGTQRIEISWITMYTVRNATIYVDDRVVGKYTNGYASGLCKMIAKNDGFESVEDFFKWFSSDFKGKIIHWTDLRY